MASITQRLNSQYQQQFGRAPDAADPQYGEWIKTALPSIVASDRDAYERSKARWGVADKIAMGATMAGLTAGFGSILGAGAPAVSHGYSSPGIFSNLFGAGSATAPVATAATTGGTVARLGSILGSRGFETAGNLGLGIAGMVSQNRANAQARRDTLAAQTKAIEVEQQRLALEARNADLDRADAQKLNDAIQALEQKKFALQQEQAQFERGVMEEDLGAKRDYRNTIQMPAARRMASILGF